MLRKSKKWLVTIWVTILGCGAFEISLFIYQSLLSNSGSHESVPWTWASLWAIAVIIAVFIIVGKFGINLEKYFWSLLIGAFLASILWGFFPDSLKPIDTNYWGIESRLLMDRHSEGLYDERTEFDFPLKTGFLYAKDDPKMIRALAVASSHNEYVNKRGVFFGSPD